VNAPLPKPKDFDPQQKAAKENVFGDRIEDVPPPQNRVGMSVDGTFPTISLVSLGSPPNRPEPGDPIRGYYVEADSVAAGRVTSTMPSQTGQTGERSTSQARVKVRALPVPTPVLDRYRIVQLWEGTITDCSNKTFGATLRDLSGGAGD